MGENPLQGVTTVPARTELGGAGPSTETRSPRDILFAMQDEFAGRQFGSGPEVVAAVSPLNRQARIAFGGGVPYAIAVLGNYSRAEEKIMTSGLDFNDAGTRTAAKAMREAVLAMQLKIAELGEPTPEDGEPVAEPPPLDDNSRTGQYL